MVSNDYQFRGENFLACSKLPRDTQRMGRRAIASRLHTDIQMSDGS